MAAASTIKDLVQTLEDGRKGFSDAAEKLADDGNAARAGTFQKYADQRTRFSAELREAARRDGVQVDEDGSIAGALHRGWISLKDALTGDSPEAIEKAALTGEEHAVSEYEKALDDDDLPMGLRPTIEQQLAQIKGVRDELQASTKASTTS